jgi:hypothetical protein
MQLLDNRPISVREKSLELKSKMSLLTVAHPHVVCAEQKLAKLLRKSPLDAEGLLITAPSGMGKTNFAKAVFRCLSAGVVNTPNADKRPVIFVDAPQLSSRGGLATELLIALDDKSPTKGVVNEKVHRIANYCRRQEVKLIIIDEIHDFLPKTADGNTPTVEFLKKLLNAAKVPFLFMGTEKAKRLISNHPELAGRFEERVEFPTFEYGPTKFSKHTFAQIVNTYARVLNEAGTELVFFSKKQNKPVLENEDLLKRIYLGTNGNLRSLRNLFQHLVDVVLDGREANLVEFACAWTPAMNNKLKFNPFEKQNLAKVSKLINSMSNKKAA